VEVMGESKGERCARAAKLSMPAESLPLFTGVRGIEILGSSLAGSWIRPRNTPPRCAKLSPNRSALRELLCMRTPAHNTRRYEPPLAGASWPVGPGLCAIHQTTHKKNSANFALTEFAEVPSVSNRWPENQSETPSASCMGKSWPAQTDFIIVWSHVA
jgi:hypothetical protein